MTDYRDPSGSTAIGVQQVTLECLPGCRFGLDQPTAVIRLRLKGRVQGMGERLGRLSAMAYKMMPDEPLYLAPPERWPGAFLISGGQASDEPDPLRRLGEWLTASVIMIQRYARQPVGWGSVLTAGQKGMVFAVPWTRRDVLEGALRRAVRWVLLMLSAPFDALAKTQASWQQDLIEWLDTLRPSQMGLNTQRFALAALNEGIPIVPIAQDTLQVGWGARSRWLESSMNDATGGIAMRMARHKGQTGRRLADCGIPVPETLVAKASSDLPRVAESLGYPLVVKPANQDAAEGVSVNISNAQDLSAAFETALKFSPGGVLVQPFLSGTDHRLLVVNHECLMVSKRHPAGVTGDGEHSVRELVDLTNRHPYRGTRKLSTLKKIVLDDDSHRWLKAQGVTLDSVPEAGSFVRLRSIPNMTTGGVHENVTESVHPDNKALAVAAADAVRLNVAGIDMLCPDISRSWRDVGATVIEVNGQPNVSLHWTFSPDANIYRQMLMRLDIEDQGHIPLVMDLRRSATKGCYRLWEQAAFSGSATMVRATTSEANWSDIRQALTDSTTGGLWISADLAQVSRKGFPCKEVDTCLLSLGQDEVTSSMIALCRELLLRTRQAVLVDARLVEALMPDLERFPGKVVVVDESGEPASRGSDCWGRVVVGRLANGSRHYTFEPGDGGERRRFEVAVKGEEGPADFSWMLAVSALSGRFDLLTQYSDGDRGNVTH